MTGDRSVLVCAAGSSTGFSLVSAARRRFGRGVRILTMDTHPAHLVAASEEADHHVVCRPADHAGFAEDLRSSIRAFMVGTVVPLLPLEFVAASRLREEGLIDGAVRVLAPSSKASLLCADKLLLSRALAGASIPVPETWALPDAPIAERLFLKPRVGWGSRGCHLATSGASCALPGPPDPADWVAQVPCDGPEVTVDVYRSPDGGFARALCRERVEVRSGVSVKCRIFEDDHLARLACRVSGTLGLVRTSNVQFMRLLGQWVVTDVNPRPGGGTAMGELVGNHFPLAHLADRLGLDPDALFAPLSGDAWVLRHPADRLMMPRTHVKDQ